MSQVICTDHATDTEDDANEVLHTHFGKEIKGRNSHLDHQATKEASSRLNFTRAADLDAVTSTGGNAGQLRSTFKDDN